MDIIKAAKRTRLLIENCSTLDRFPNTSGPLSVGPLAIGPLSLNHIVMMLQKIELGEVTGEKAHRWLGWAQCATVAGGVGTLETMTDINKLAEDK